MNQALGLRNMRMPRVHVQKLHILLSYGPNGLLYILHTLASNVCRSKVGVCVRTYVCVYICVLVVSCMCVRVALRVMYVYVFRVRCGSGSGARPRTNTLHNDVRKNNSNDNNPAKLLGLLIRQRSAIPSASCGNALLDGHCSSFRRTHAD